MGEKGLRVEDLVFSNNNGFVLVDVPREHTSEVQRRLVDLGIGSWLHAGGEDEAAVIHPHTNLAPARIRALLAGQGWPSRHGGDRGDQPHKEQA